MINEKDLNGRYICDKKSGTITFIENPQKTRNLFDHFAGQALQGMIASGWDMPKSVIAQKAYEFARAMMKERENANQDT